MNRRIEDARRVARDVRAQIESLGSRSGRSYALTLVTPIEPGKGPKLGRVLTDLPAGDASPLAVLPDVHFARWVVIDRLNTDWPRAPRRPSRLKSDYLMFTADVTAPDRDDHKMPESFLRQMIVRIPKTVDRVWGYCLEYPKTCYAERCLRYLLDSQVSASLYYVGHPDVTVSEVRRALVARDGLIEFVRRRQGSTGAAELQRAYLEEARQWFS